MKLISWNVNGIRAVHKKGLTEFLEREDPDVFCVQETKAEASQCEAAITAPLGRVSYWSSATTKKGYSGTATFLRAPAHRVAHGIGKPEYDSEGRFVITDLGDFILYNIYFPNGGSGPERHEYKQRFLTDLNAHLKRLIAAGYPLVVVGDYNVAHRDIDVYDPIRLAGESGFLPEEREWFDSFLQLGFVDSFRHFHPDARQRFTWWNQFERARVSNRGWRIDYVCVTKSLVSRLRRAEQLEGQMGSDHCPVLVELG